MPRHSASHNHTMPFFTYEERRQLKKAQNWGGESMRAGADSIKDFDACSLCLHLADEPVMCTKGHLYCKACVYEHLLSQKAVQKKQLEKWTAQQAESAAAGKVSNAEQKAKQLQQFDENERSILPAPYAAAPSSPAAAAAKSAAATKGKTPPPGYIAITTADGKQTFVVDKDKVKEHSVSTKDLSAAQREDRKGYLPCFWIPSMTPDSGKEKVEKPATHTMCPEGAHVLRLKQLRPVRFTPQEVPSATAAAAAGSASSPAAKSKKPATAAAAGGDEKGSSSSSSSSSSSKSSSSALVSGTKGRYMCPSCRRGLSNVVKTAFLSKCGHVLCLHCIDTFVRKDGGCTHCGTKLNSPESDIIPMAFGGTGFAAHGSTTIVRKDAPSFLSG